MKKARIVVTIFGYLILIGSSTALGNDDVASDSVKYRFDPIVVTATKVSEAQRDLAASITSIDLNLIKQAPTAAVLDVVQTHVPSLYVTEWGVMGFGAAGSAAGKISIRGLGGAADTHVLILRNGRPDFMGLMGCTIADEFATDGVERVEVLRGPASFLYGSNATAGVINIVSREMKEGFETRFTGGLGSYSSRKLSAIHGGRIGNFGYTVTAARRTSDGHRTDARSDYDADHFTCHLAYHIGRGTEIEMNANLADIYLYDPGPVSTPEEDDWYDIKRWGGDITVNHNGRLGSSYLKLHGNFGHHEFFDGWRSNDRMLGVMVYHNLRPWAGNTTMLGLDFKRYGGDAEDTESLTDYGEYFVTEYAPYVHTQQLFLGRFIASAGLRVEHHELYGSEIVPKLGVVSHLSQSTSIRVSVAKGFRSPSIRELYFFPIHNSDLKPDEVWNYEIGLSQHFGTRMKVELAVFRSEAENLIITAKNSNPPPFYRLTNSGELSNTGYELMLNWSPRDPVELGVSWSYVDMENPIPNAPGKKFSAYATYRFWGVSLSANLIVVKDWVGTDNASPVKSIYQMDDYTVLNLSTQARVYGPIGVNVAVRNALDADYQAMYGYPMPGRTFGIDISYSF